MARGRSRLVTPGLLRVIGLPIAMSAVMIGFVFVVNPGLWGVAGVAGGTATTIAGIAATVRIYRMTAPSAGDPRVTSRRTDGDEEP